MLTQEEDVEVHALRRRGWSISAIARHLGRSRITIRAYLNGERRPGERRRSQADPLAPYEAYVRQRLNDDPHVWATSLLDELRPLGYASAYSTFTEALRQRQLRPHCEACAGVKGRPTLEIAHPPGEEIQWDFMQLPAPWGGESRLFKGALSHSGKYRGLFCEAEDEAHWIAGIDAVLRKLGGTPRRWRVDRTSAVCNPKTGRVKPSFAAFAKFYGAMVDVCPPRRGNRKGVVEKRNDFSARRWWRTADVRTEAEAQVSFDRFCEHIADQLPRHGTTVAEAAAREPLLPLPPRPYPATIVVDRIASASALVAFEGNQYGVSPGFAGRLVQVRTVLGATTLEVVTPSGVVVAQHRRAPSGARAVIRAVALEQEDRHTSVTFIHLACSGATVDNGVLGAQHEPPGCGSCVVEPQITKAESLLNGLRPDTIFLSLGGNDMGFSTLINTCAADARCPVTKDRFIGLVHTTTAQTLHDQTEISLGGLAISYGRVAACLSQTTQTCEIDNYGSVPSLGVVSGDVFITEYPDATKNDSGQYCDGSLPGLAYLPGGSGHGISAGEYAWADAVAMHGLKGQTYTYTDSDPSSFTKALKVSASGLDTLIDSTGKSQKWHPVLGISDLSHDHGYCATESWFVTFDDSMAIQGDPDGTFHPNGAGHLVMADQLAGDAIPRLGLP